MSFRGQIEAQCPGGCESFSAEVWSYIRGDRDSPLRLSLLARECNLLLCPSCGRAFFPEASYVYFEPESEILAFVFPESYKEREPYWREKMREDFTAMKEALAEDFPLDIEPEIFFGPDGLAELLAREDYRGEEQEVLDHVARELGLSLQPVSARYARERDLPRSLPFEGERFTRESAIRGLERVLESNERLQASARQLAELKRTGGDLPPPAARRQAA